MPVVERTLQCQLIKSEDTGKFRVLLEILEGEWLQVSTVLTADQAEKLATQLMELSRGARGKNIILPMSEAN
jgi:hypothetical protein